MHFYKGTSGHQGTDNERLVKYKIASKVEGIHVIGNNQDILPLVYQLQDNEKKKIYFNGPDFRDVRMKTSDDSGPYLRDYYAQQPPIIMRSILRKANKASKTNSGFAFISFNCAETT